MGDSLAVFSAADSDRWQRMYLRAIERHHENLDAILNVVALGGDLKNVVRCVVDWLDGMDALADTDHDLLRRAWVAAGGTLDDFPVTVVWSAIGNTAVVDPIAPEEAPDA